MKSLHRIAIAAPLIVLHAWAGEIPSKQIAARTELHQIQTLTLSDQQFLNADTGGKPVTITGQLRIAQGSGRLPVVVLQHGSGGYKAKIHRSCIGTHAPCISTFALATFIRRVPTEVQSTQALP